MLDDENVTISKERGLREVGFCGLKIILVIVKCEYVGLIDVCEHLCVQIDEKTALSKEDKRIGDSGVLNMFVEFAFIHRAFQL